MIGEGCKMKRVQWAGFVALILVLAAPYSTFGGDDPLPALSPEAKQLLEEARRQLAGGHPAAATDAFRRANEAAGGKCLECARDLVFIHPGLPEEAIEATRHAIPLLAGDPGQGRAYCQLGDLLLLERGKPAAAEAEQAYEKAVELGPTYRAQGLAGIADARLRRELYREAAEAALQAIQAAPDGAPAGKARSTICVARRAGGLTPEAAPMPPAESSQSPAIPWRTNPSNPPPAGDEPFRVGGSVMKPTKLYAPPPVYTESARKQRVEGSVIAEAIIDRDGCVTEAHILKSMPLGLDTASLSAMKRWVFAPATLAGKPVKVWYTLTVNFAVEHPPTSAPTPDPASER